MSLYRIATQVRKLLWSVRVTCFACCVQAEHENSHFPVGKELVHDFADGATHVGRGASLVLRQFVRDGGSKRGDEIG